MNRSNTNRVREKVYPSLTKGKCRIHTWSRSGLLPRAAPRQRALPALSAAAADCAAATQSSRGLHYKNKKIQEKDEKPLEKAE